MNGPPVSDPSNRAIQVGALLIVALAVSVAVAVAVSYAPPQRVATHENAGTDAPQVELTHASIPMPSPAPVPATVSVAEPEINYYNEAQIALNTKDAELADLLADKLAQSHGADADKVVELKQQIATQRKELHARIFQALGYRHNVTLGLVGAEIDSKTSGRVNGIRVSKALLYSFGDKVWLYDFALASGPTDDIPAPPLAKGARRYQLTLKYYLVGASNWKAAVKAHIPSLT